MRDEKGQPLTTPDDTRAFSDLHVLDIHDRLLSRRHARGQLPLRHGCALHEWVAIVRFAGLLLRSVPQVAAAKNSSLLGQVQRAVHVSVEALRFDRQRKESIELLHQQYGRRRAFHSEPRAIRRILPVVPGRQPGPRSERTRRSGAPRSRDACATPCSTARWRRT